MIRACIVPIILPLAIVAHLAAGEPRRSGEHVHFKLRRDVRGAVQEEIARFEKELKNKLGPQKLAHRPFAEAEDVKQSGAEALTVEQILDQSVAVMRQWAQQDNQQLLPVFAAFRRAPVASGSDLLSAPVKGPDPASLSGNVTIRLQWEVVDGRFKNQWDHNSVDEVYEVELNGTLTLGIEWTVAKDRSLMFLSHSVTRPIVQGWRTSLVASEGEVQKILNAD
jgi:hypothetical protein